MATPKKASQEVAEVTEPSDANLELHKENLKDVNASLQGLDFVPESWEQVAEAFEGELMVFEGSPWKVRDKDSLIGTPFVICDVRFYWSDKFDSPVVAVCAMDKENERFVFNDGSTGLFEQMKHMVLTSKRKAGILCEGGLRKSEYKIWDKIDLDGNPMPDAKQIEAATYYIA